MTVHISPEDYLRVMDERDNLLIGPARYNQPERWIKFGAAFSFLAFFGVTMVKWPDQLGPGLSFFGVLTAVFALATMAHALSPHGRGDEYFEE